MERVRISVEKLRQIFDKVKKVEKSHDDTRALCYLALIVSIASLVLHAI